MVENCMMKLIQLENNFKSVDVIDNFRILSLIINSNGRKFSDYKLCITSYDKL